MGQFTLHYFPLQTCLRTGLLRARKINTHFKKQLFSDAYCITAKTRMVLRMETIGEAQVKEDASKELCPGTKEAAVVALSNNSQWVVGDERPASDASDKVNFAITGHIRLPRWIRTTSTKIAEKRDEAPTRPKISWGSSDCSELLWRLARVLCEKAKLSKNKADREALMYEALAVVQKALEKEPKDGCFGAHKWYAILLDYVGEIEGNKSRLQKSYKESCSREHVENSKKCRRTLERAPPPKSRNRHRARPP
ncbi:hypothetical protein TELCIR_09988 [Teladorsagia circumcincta]|uniref:Uncharacterized protein n=1 Tax=Teladorsagia circumcincta TaxID=45464 RepID=A0A2G9UFH0_TELCI|nr:hypothetical protein TELCIR_09988 [Teladorsagia circumcincta]